TGTERVLARSLEEHGALEEQERCQAVLSGGQLGLGVDAQGGVGGAEGRGEVASIESRPELADLALVAGSTSDHGCEPQGREPQNAPAQRTARAGCQADRARGCGVHNSLRSRRGPGLW